MRELSISITETILSDGISAFDVNISDGIGQRITIRLFATEVYSAYQQAEELIEVIKSISVNDVNFYG